MSHSQSMLMSSAPNSPPETPQRTIAVGNGNLTPRTRLPEGKSKPSREEESNPPPKISGSQETLDFFQVPSASLAADVKPEEKSQQVHAQAEVENENWEEKDEGSTTSDAELFPFDWNDLERRYTEALKDADVEECKLVDEFEELYEAFSVWATVSSQGDSERALKRLKTRERYVQLSEAALDEKKNHYVQVVQAFAAALNLLKSPSGRR